MQEVIVFEKKAFPRRTQVGYPRDAGRFCTNSTPISYQQYGFFTSSAATPKQDKVLRMHGIRLSILDGDLLSTQGR